MSEIHDWLGAQHEIGHLQGDEHREAMREQLELWKAAGHCAVWDIHTGAHAELIVSGEEYEDDDIIGNYTGVFDMTLAVKLHAWGKDRDNPDAKPRDESIRLKAEGFIIGVRSVIRMAEELKRRQQRSDDDARGKPELP
ncbi:MAG: hypothetical protein ACRCYU_14870 [Nocardioides sp.]